MKLTCILFCSIFLLLISCETKDTSIYKVFPLEVKVEDTFLDINCQFGTEVSFEDIVTVTISDDLPKVEGRTWGTSIPGKVHYGNFMLEGEGKGKLYLQSTDGRCVKLDLRSGSYVYINFYYKDKTELLHTLILDALQKFNEEKSN